jgi:hypothetical protein
MMVGFLPDVNHRILTTLLKAIQISKTRALNAVSIHKHLKDLLRAYKYFKKKRGLKTVHNY